MDSKKCINNIRFLAKEQNVRIGKVETDAGVAPGYLSRFGKDSSESMPNVEVLSAFAKALNVSIDSLINLDYTQLTATDRYMLDFLNDLTKKTISQKVLWTVQRPEDFRDIDFDANGLTDNPLFTVVLEKSVNCVAFNSRFRGLQTELLGDSFVVETGSYSYLYLMSVDWTAGAEKSNQEYELYYIEGNDVYPLCHLTSDEDSLFNEPIKQLYYAAKESLSHIRISENVKEALTAFLRSGNSDNRPN